MTDHFTEEPLVTLTLTSSEAQALLEHLAFAVPLYRSIDLTQLDLLQRAETRLAEALGHADPAAATDSAELREAFMRELDATEPLETLDLNAVYALLLAIKPITVLMPELREPEGTMLELSNDIQRGVQHLFDHGLSFIPGRDPEEFDRQFEEYREAKFSDYAIPINTDDEDLAF